MDVVKIPFVSKVGIQKTPDGKLELKIGTEVFNHLKTIHASAQFALAETASGEFLQTLFPHLVDRVIPVLRESGIKFKKPAVNNIFAYPSITDESRKRFDKKFSNKGRASITVEVEIRDIEGTVTCVGFFNWFVSKIDA